MAPRLGSFWEFASLIAKATTPPSGRRAARAMATTMPTTTFFSLAFCAFWTSASRALRSWLAFLLLTGSSQSGVRGSRAVYGGRSAPSSVQRVRLSACPRPSRHRTQTCPRWCGSGGPGGRCRWARSSRVFRRGGGDPTFQADRGQGWWLGLPTPEGPATLQLEDTGGRRRGRGPGVGAGCRLGARPGAVPARRRRRRRRLRGPPPAGGQGAAGRMPGGTSRGRVWSCTPSCRRSSSRR